MSFTGASIPVLRYPSHKRFSDVLNFIFMWSKACDTHSAIDGPLGKVLFHKLLTCMIRLYPVSIVECSG